MRICPYCNTFVPENVNYCPFCGKPLSKHQDRKRFIAIAAVASGVLLLFSTGLIINHVANHNNNPGNIVADNSIESVDNSTILDHTASQADERDTLAKASQKETNSFESDEKNGKTDVVTMHQAEAAIAQIDNTMSRYVGVVLMKQKQDGKNQKAGDCFEVSLTDAEKIRAAALASAPDGVIDAFFRENNIGIVLDENAMSGPNGDGYHGMSVAGGSVERNCMNLFGTESIWEELQTREKCHLYDAVKYTDSAGTYAILIDKEIESEILGRTQK